MPTPPKLIVFDVFGTLVDWRTSVTRAGEKMGAKLGLAVDWGVFAQNWRDLYIPAIREVQSGQMPWTILDDLHRRSLDTTLARHGIGKAVPESERAELNLIWHRLEPWPDVLQGMNELAACYPLATMSNGNFALLTDLKRFAKLPFDAIFASDMAHAYKPDIRMYALSWTLMRLKPEDVLLVAAHNGDLQAAKSHGMQTAYVDRPNEHRAGHQVDLGPTGDYDYIASSMPELAGRLNCP